MALGVGVGDGPAFRGGVKVEAPSASHTDLGVVLEPLAVGVEHHRLATEAIGAQAEVVLAELTGLACGVVALAVVDLPVSNKAIKAELASMTPYIGLIKTVIELAMLVEGHLGGPDLFLLGIGQALGLREVQKVFL